LSGKKVVPTNRGLKDGKDVKDEEKQPLICKVLPKMKTIEKSGGQG